MFAWIVEVVRRKRLIAISFVTGFSLLTYELAAARVLAPSIGSSTYVWTGVIGVIIAALSLGFFVGGKVADARNKAIDLVLLLLLASCMVALTMLTYENVLKDIVLSIDDNRLQAVVAALLLFAPASFFIGMTSPYLAKLNVQSLKSTGQSIASLDMFNAIGGITGTFVTGFVLFGFIGSREAIGLVAVLLLVISWLIAPTRHVIKRSVISVILILVVATPAVDNPNEVSIDTASANYKVITGFYGYEPVAGLLTGPGGTQSAVYKNGLDEPVFWYTKEMTRLTIARQPDSILILGGGAFTMPQYLSTRLPESTIDVVEIDPKLEDISKEYFDYTSPKNVNEIFTDARTYVNQTDKKYDAILVDVYGDASIPFSLMTKQYGQSIANALNPGGVVIANIIAGFDGACRDTFAAVDSAYRTELPNAVYSNESGLKENRANHIVMYSRDRQQAEGLRQLPSFGVQPYTDNYAPAERLYYDCRSLSK